MVLTCIRFFVSPTVIPALIYFLLPYNNVWFNGIVALIFIIVSMTDFLDGYYARLKKMETVEGAFLDPIADKCLFFSTFISLVTINKLFFYWAILFIARDFFVMSLRCFAYKHGFSLPVIFMAKMKTFCLLILCTVIIANPYQSLGFTHAPYWNSLEMVLLLLSLFFSLFSAVCYYYIVREKWKGVFYIKNDE
ncbi:MAG: CDP-alcohol phosphatidyltransferase family protein [Candidatus Babeliales bacterium]